MNYKLWLLILCLVNSRLYGQFDSNDDLECSKSWSKAFDLYKGNRFQEAIPLFWKAMECDKILRPLAAARKYPSVYMRLIECYDHLNQQDSVNYIRKLAASDSIDFNAKATNVSENAFTDPPIIIGGYSSMKKYLTYPKKAKKDGVEGNVLLKIHIDDNGKVLEMEVLREDGNYGFAEAAMECVKRLKWQPAKSDGKPVDCWIAFPITFKLK